MTTPILPTAGNTPSENNLFDSNLKAETRGLLQAAKNKIESDTAASVLEKVVGGSGRTKTSSDLEGIAALISATQGGANQTMGNAVGLLTGLLSRQDSRSGNTQSSMDDILKMILIMKMLKEDQPQQNNQMEAMMSYMTKIMEMQGLRFADYIEMNKQHNDWVINDLKERSGPDPLTAQLYSQWLPTIVQQSLGQANKDPVDHLLDSVDKLEKLKGISGLFGNNGGSLAEKLQMKGLEIQDRDMILSHQREMAKIKTKREAPQQWGGLLHQIFGKPNDGPGGGGMNFASMMQGLSGGGPGDPAQQGAM